MTRKAVEPSADIDRPPEFSVPVRVVDIPSGGKTFDLSADEATRQKIAERLGLLSLDRLQGSVTLRPLAAGPMVLAMGNIDAVYDQECVVTLEPVHGELNAEIAVEYAPEEPESETPKEREFTLEDADPPEAIVDGEIDLGELLSQQLALSLDPFPRKPDADLDTVLDDLPKGRRAAIEREAPTGPFAELEKLKKKDG